MIVLIRLAVRVRSVESMPGKGIRPRLGRRACSNLRGVQPLIMVTPRLQRLLTPWGRVLFIRVRTMTGKLRQGWAKVRQPRCLVADTTLGSRLSPLRPIRLSILA